MKHGKREMPRNHKGLAAFAALVLVLCCTVGGTVAWLATTAGPVTNTFTPSHVTTYVDESFDGTTKSDVKIQNTGDTDAYIRAAIVCNWVNADGEVYAQMPEPSIGSNVRDYTIDLNTGSDSDKWTKVTGKDGIDYYYYNSVVSAGVETANLINSCTEIAGKAPEGYRLQVTILADGIQAKGMGDNITTAQQAFAAAKS